MTLTEFLLARIAEDEADARHALFDEGDGGLSSRQARVVAECKAKRRIVELHHGSRICPTCAGDDRLTYVGDIALPTGKSTPCPTLRHLAAVYADHPDYDENWRP